MESHLVSTEAVDDPDDVLRKSEMHRERSLAQEAMAREVLQRMTPPPPLLLPAAHLDACPEDAPLLRQPSKPASAPVPCAGSVVVNDRYRGHEQQEEPLSPLPSGGAPLPELLVSADDTPAAARGGRGIPSLEL